MESSKLDSYKHLPRNIGSEFEVFMDHQNFIDNLMPILDKLPLLKIREGYILDVFPSLMKCVPYCYKKGARVQYIPSVHGVYNDSLKINYCVPESVPEVLSYFEVPFTEVGIMQAWLLVNITYFMPVFGHARYGKEHFIFQTECIDRLFPESVGKSKGSLENRLKLERQRVRDKVLALDIESLLPTITINGDSAIMEYAYWNDWSGMVKVRTEVIKEVNSVRFLQSEWKVLVEYKCSVEL